METRKLSFAVGRDIGRKEERAAIVAFVRKADGEALARAIERGDHLSKSEDS